MAKLQWYVRKTTETKFFPRDEVFAGTYNGSEPLRISTRLWNNRYGETSVDSLENFNIKIYFDNDEDQTLLKYCTVIINEKEQIPLEITNKYGLIVMDQDTSVSGAANNGVEEENKENYLTIDLSFDVPEEIRLKEQDIKNIYFEIIKK